MRLIDADAMLERLEAWNTKDNMDKALYNFALNRVIEQPTAVGQCDDCKHADYYPDYELIYCSEISCVMPFDGFCHRFEKNEVNI